MIQLLEKIGEGGCGVVYLAGQQELVRRRVALKLIKLGMDTNAVVARFEAEPPRDFYSHRKVRSSGHE
jgi:eukaryotic-like serine/threonine-protein kinase